MPYNGYGGYMSTPYVYGSQTPVYQPSPSFQPNYNPQAVASQPNSTQTAQQAVQVQSQPVQAQTPTRSNKVFVASIDDATNRYADPNTEIIYLHQDKPFIFEVFTDWQGKKTVKTYRFEECTVEEMQDETRGIVKNDLENFAKKDDLMALRKEMVTKEDLEDFESRLAQFVKQSTSKSTKAVKETLPQIEE